MPSPDEHFEQLTKWLQMESQAESERMASKRLLRNSKLAEATGETILDLVIADSEPGIGGRFLVTLVKRNREIAFPWSRLKVGAPILLARFRDDDGESWPAVVSKRQSDSMQIAINEIPDGETFRIDLASDEVTRKRCDDAIQTVINSSGRLNQIKNVLLGQRQPEFSPEKSISKENSYTNLNPSQWKAIEFCLSALDVAVIHGPPGTGKTTTVAELIFHAVQSGDKVLACAPSNTAVDNLVLKLCQRGLKPIRLGHPARVSPDLQNRTLDSLASQDANMRIAKEMFQEAAEIFRKLDRYTRAKPDRDSRRELRQQAKQLRRDARMMEQQAVQHVLDQANIVCATTTIDNSILGDRQFDLLIIDEACQSTEPPCWIPVCRSNKIVLAGDHCQLPPTVISQRAAREGFSISLMERLIDLYGDSICQLLDVQYRMNDLIMQFSSNHFYERQLNSSETVANQTLAEAFPQFDLSEFGEAILFVDTAGANWNDELEPDGESRRNPNEADFVLQQAKSLQEIGVPLRDIAIIVPYAAQVRLIKAIANQQFGQSHQLEIDTVDGFQGREKEIVLISLVRSNENCEIGFLSDTRRMNVAMTRAKRRLFIVGDSATIGVNDFFAALLEYFEANDAYRSIWQYQT